MNDLMKRLQDIGLLLLYAALIPLTLFILKKLMMGKKSLLGEFLRHIYRKGRTAARQLMGRIRRLGWVQGLLERKRGMKSSMDDERERVLSWAGIRQKYKEDLREWWEKLFDRKQKWEELRDDRERILFLYYRFILHCINTGYRFRHHFTPTETLFDIKSRNPEIFEEMDTLKDCYNLARYGRNTASKKINPETIQTLRESLRKIKMRT